MRRGDPPPIEFFESPPAPPGNRSVVLTLGEVRIELAGLDDGRAQGLLARYGVYCRDGTAGESPALRSTLGLSDRDYFIDPPPEAELNPVWLAFDPGRVRYLGYKLAGWFETTVPGRGVMLLARGTYEPDIRSFENYVRSAVAWQAVTRGGAFVHAASAVLEGRAYIFYGESGAGKSTLSASNRRARVVSDDLSLLLPGPDGRLRLIGSPFRGTYEEGEPVVGAFPLAAGFRLIQSRSAEVRQVPRVRAMAELVGNLPFVAEAFERYPELFARVERSFDGIPLAHLHFRKDDSYWDAIEGAGL